MARCSAWQSRVVCTLPLTRGRAFVPPCAGKKHDFAFHFSYNSFGPESPEYASQAAVWNDIGDGVLANAYEGT